METQLMRHNSTRLEHLWRSSAVTKTKSRSVIARDAGRKRLADQLSSFAPIGLDEMNGVALLDRSEVKYVMNLRTLLECLPELQAAYRMLNVRGNRLNQYRTLYFDTQDLLFYRRHHMGARNRYKVRSREYVDTHISFFEVKQKTSKRRTVKHRLSTPQLMIVPNGDSGRFLSQVSPYRIQELAPRIWNHYQRITLVSKDTPERVTLDIDLVFRWEDRQQGLPGIVIAEVKQPNHSGQSAFVQLMRSRHIHCSGFSKYCMGISLLYPGIKHNRFKPIHRRIARLMEQKDDVYH